MHVQNKLIDRKITNINGLNYKIITITMNVKGMFMRFKNSRKEVWRIRPSAA